MGAACYKNKTRIIKIESKPTPSGRKDKITYNTNKYIGEQFQIEVEKHDKDIGVREREWTQLYQKVQDFETDEVYITLLNNTSFENDIIQFNQLEDIKATPKKQKCPELNSISNNLGGTFQWHNKNLLNAYIIKTMETTKFSYLLMQGAIAKYRWNTWLSIVYKNDLYDPLLYEQLLEKYDQKSEESINKDIARTFPDHQLFQEQEQQNLYKILKALALQYPDIGYVQGMNQIVGFALIASGGNQEEVFWFINFIAQDKRFLWWDFYKIDFGFSKYLCQIFKINFTKQLPGLDEHFQNQGMIEQQYIFPWVLTMFLNTFPMEDVLFFWDFVLATNIYSFISISLAVLYEMGGDLINLDIGEISDYFRSLRSKKGFLNVKNILDQAKQFNKTLLDDLESPFSQLIQKQ